VITHPATLDVSRELAQQVSRLLHAERRRRGTRKRSRALTCFRHAVLGLRWFRHGTDITALARDHGISRATGYRYIEEVVTVLAPRSSRLARGAGTRESRRDDVRDPRRQDPFPLIAVARRPQVSQAT
jgi:hypothetical protein